MYLLWLSDNFQKTNHVNIAKKYKKIGRLVHMLSTSDFLFFKLIKGLILIISWLYKYFKVDVVIELSREKAFHIFVLERSALDQISVW